MPQSSTPQTQFYTTYNTLPSYNPWWRGEWGQRKIEPFHRPIFNSLWEDLQELPQIISIAGPRRIGKTTLLLQLIEKLIKVEKVSPERVLYLSLDDPTLSTMDGGRQVFEHILGRYFSQSNRQAASSQPVYIFLDEIQKYEHWELYLKKYYDQGYPIRWVVTGSASSPILRKSRESLLGRIRENHLLPFSFREYLLFKFQNEETLIRHVENLRRWGTKLAGVPTPTDFDSLKHAWNALWNQYSTQVETLFEEYLLMGGFPEVWGMDSQRRQEYLWDNQVKKVIFEDLATATSFRKPRNIARFYVYLTTRPGDEIRVDKVASEIRASRLMLEKYISLLEMTDLVKTVPKFSKKPLRRKRTGFKVYLVDLAIHNAVMKLTTYDLRDPQRLGRMAENLVFRTLFPWRESVELTHYRERQEEIDFVVTLGPNRFLPIEVKFGSKGEGTDCLERFLENFR
jgi:predicted AAA+ superfamily ATPase